MQLSAAGAEAYAHVLALSAKCSALRTQAETDAKLAAYEAGCQERERMRAIRMRQEEARNKAEEAERYAEKAAKEQKEKLAAGMVEVRVDPGARWNLEWFRANISHRVPEIDPKRVDGNLGVLALLRAVDLLEIKRKSGRPVSDPAGFVVHEARKVMAPRGGPTTWVTAEVARQQPHLIVRQYSESFAGRVADRWKERRELLKTDEQRRAMGLLPLSGVRREG